MDSEGLFWINFWTKFFLGLGLIGSLIVGSVTGRIELLIISILCVIGLIIYPLNQSGLSFNLNKR